MRSTPSLRSFPNVAFETSNVGLIFDDGPISTPSQRRGNIGKTAEGQGRAHMGFPVRYDAICNLTELNILSGVMWLGIK